MIRTTVCAVVAVCSAAGAAAQAPRAFDVVSVRQNTSGDPGAILDMSRGQLRAINAPLQIVIRQAFEVMDSQIVGAPGWVASDRYDIIAKAPEGVVTAEAIRPLMRALLAERFRLATHTEKREMPVYALVLAKADGSLGPHIRQVADTDCTAKPPAAPAPAPTNPDEWPYCSVTISPGSLYFGGFRMTEITRILSTLVGRTIIDETGISGPVQFRLQYQRGRGASPPAVPAGALDEKPDIFTALQEQAGLKLDARRAPVDVLVIDRIDRPTED
jgi:uncharacterized protein (TIGR03435 family)